jgi:hypothetical protein
VVYGLAMALGYLARYVGLGGWMGVMLEGCG